jgi:hypothetical protein
MLLLFEVFILTLIDTILDGRYSEIKVSDTKRYRFDKLIFTSIILVALIFSVIVLQSNNYDKSQKVYLNCDSKTPCFNPYYESNICGTVLELDNYLCTTDVVPSGYVYGTPTPFYIKNFSTIIIGFILVGLLVNHFTYNKGVLSSIKKDGDLDVQ